MGICYAWMIPLVLNPVWQHISQRHHISSVLLNEYLFQNLDWVWGVNAFSFKAFILIFNPLQVGVCWWCAPYCFRVQNWIWCQNHSLPFILGTILVSLWFCHNDAVNCDTADIFSGFCTSVCWVGLNWVCTFAGKFENGIAEGTVDPSLNPISSFRLSVIQNSAVWAILNEVRGGRTLKNITSEWEFWTSDFSQTLKVVTSLLRNVIH